MNPRLTFFLVEAQHSRQLGSHGASTSSHTVQSRVTRESSIENEMPYKKVTCSAFALIIQAKGVCGFAEFQRAGKCNPLWLRMRELVNEEYLKYQLCNGKVAFRFHFFPILSADNS